MYSEDPRDVALGVRQDLIDPALQDIQIVLGDAQYGHDGHVANSHVMRSQCEKLLVGIPLLGGKVMPAAVMARRLSPAPESERATGRQLLHEVREAVNEHDERFEPRRRGA